MLGSDEAMQCGMAEKHEYLHESETEKAELEQEELESRYEEPICSHFWLSDEPFFPIRSLYFDEE